LQLQRPGLIYPKQRHARRCHGPGIGHASGNNAGEWSTQAGIAEHRCRAACLRARGFGLRAHRIQPCGSGLSAPHHLIHLLRAYALLRLQLPIAFQCAGRKVRIGLRGSLLALRCSHRRLCLIRRGVQCRIVEHHESLPCPHALSRTHQNLLDATHHLRREDCGFPCVQGSSRT